MPSHNLRRVQPAVRAFCRANGVPYTETGLVESYRQGLRHLADLTATDPAAPVF